MIDFRDHRDHIKTYSVILVVIEFKDSAYSVVEGVRVYNVTLVKRGEPEEDIAVSIFPSPDYTAVDTAERKRISAKLM